MRWFSGLWQGRSLAYTIVCIAALVSFVVFVVARNTPSYPKAGIRRGENSGDDAG
jgi:hypothetical protein